MECVPAPRPDVDRVATPFVPSADVPRMELPSLNVTLPVAPEDGLTVAENVISCPRVEGLSDDVNAVVVLITLADTTCVSEDDVLPVKLASPP